MDRVKHRVVYFSPAGSTRRVAERIAISLRASGQAVETQELRREKLPPPSGEPTCIWVGSPVYSLHPIPQVLRFTQELSVIRRGFGVPFVTWGCATSGTALWDLGVAMEARGYRVLGAASVPAVHSTFWLSPDPMGKGHPDEGDLSRVEALVGGVLGKLAADGPPLRPETLHYQPPVIRRAAEETGIDRTKARTGPLRVDEERCTQCGACEEACPVGAVELDPYPAFGEECILCSQCVRACPDDAIPFDPAPRMARIREMAEKFGEEAVTRIFL